MAKDDIFRLRLPEATRAAWDVAAAELGVSTAELVRDAVSFYLAEGPELRLGIDIDRVPVSGRAEAVRRANVSEIDQETRRVSRRRRRTGMCEHRIPADRFCKRCDG